MGFYIRKPFNFLRGLFRINLSQHGAGSSVGVKGARVGVDATGKPYMHGGRHGLYFRKRLKRSVRNGNASAHAGSRQLFLQALEQAEQSKRALGIPDARPFKLAGGRHCACGNYQFQHGDHFCQRCGLPNFEGLRGYLAVLKAVGTALQEGRDPQAAAVAVVQDFYNVQFCQQCGNSLATADKFCSRCGAPILT
jgi:hypothetical protein